MTGILPQAVLWRWKMTDEQIIKIVLEKIGRKVLPTTEICLYIQDSITGTNWIKANEMEEIVQEVYRIFTILKKDHLSEEVYYFITEDYFP
jgi:ABC-type antimicrobial peptide transport system permease subunit